MSNFTTKPRRPTYDAPVAVYHALPHGLRDGLRQVIVPDCYVNIGPVLAQKRAMLAQHRSQKEWLDASQGMDAYLREMESLGQEVGRMSRRFKYAEGWRRHAHLGFGPAEFNPLQQLLDGKSSARKSRA
jgi:LmbE family N-acetylglucosaminyl deacetylase